MIISGIILWLISMAIAWTAYTFWVYVDLKRKCKGLAPFEVLYITQQIDTRTKTHIDQSPKWLEWIRFVVWPYGVVERIKFYKNVMLYLQNEDS